MPGHRTREKASGKLLVCLFEQICVTSNRILLGTLKKPAVQSPSSLSSKQSSNPNETEAFDTSDELLDDLVKNATLTASRDALKQRKTARYGAQRRSCKCSCISQSTESINDARLRSQYVEHSTWV